MPYGTLSTKATFGSKIFEGCSGLQKFETYYKDYVSDDGRCYIQNGILKFFAESNLTTEYEILSDVNIHTIGKSAFEGTNISSIKLNDYIKTIEPYAFYGCKDLSKILNWDNVITISENAFNGCESLGSSDNYSDPNSVPDPIPLPKYLKKIDNFAFSNCSNLNVSRIPINVSYIGDYAFAGTSCEEIDLSDTKIHQINQCAFKNCTHLVNIKLSKNTRTIKESAFEGCKKLTTVDQDKLSQIVNYNLETIGDSAFKDCEALSDIPYYGVSYIGDYAFAGCYIKSNKEISLNNIEHIGVGCFRGSGITKLEINNNKLTQISKNAFYNCSNLTSIEIPDTIKSIGDSAFCNCGKLGYGYTKDENEEEILNKIKLPTQLKELGERCFSFDDEYKDEKKEKTIVIQNGMETIPIFTKNEINESSSSLPFYKIKVRIEIPDNKLIYFLSNEYWKLDNYIKSYRINVNNSSF